MDSRAQLVFRRGVLWSLTVMSKLYFSPTSLVLIYFSTWNEIRCNAVHHLEAIVCWPRICDSWTYLLYTLQSCHPQPVPRCLHATKTNQDVSSWTGIYQIGTACIGIHLGFRHSCSDWTVSNMLPLRFKLIKEMLEQEWNFGSSLVACV